MDPNQLLQTFQRILLTDFLRYFIPASLAFILLWVLLNRKIAHRFIQKQKPKKEMFWFEFRYSISTVLIFASIGLGIVTLKNLGVFDIYSRIEDHGWIYFTFSIILMLLFHDAYFYWTHRLMHHPRIFKRVHRVHHLSTNPSPWAAYSFHPFEAIIQALVLPILLFIMPLHGVAILIFLVYMIVRNVWGHLGYELFPKSFMQAKWLNWHTTTTHHSMHHSHSNSNYGLYFTWWDNWMRTTHKNYKKSFNEVTSRSKKRAAVLLLLGLSFSSNAQSPEGHWMTFDERSDQPLSIIKIYKNLTGNMYEGVVDSIIVPPHLMEDGVCSMCKGQKSGQRIVGMEMLWGFRKSADEWKDGKILDPESGDLYSSKIWFDNADEIFVRGYGGPFDLFYRTQKWRRIEGSSDIEGVWESIDDRFSQPRAHIELRVMYGELKGFIKKFFLLPHEGNNPICIECEDELNGKPIVGMKIMTNYIQKGDRWTGGSVMDPGNGTTYASSFWLEGDDTLVIRGYWGPFFRTQRWKKVGD